MKNSNAILKPVGQFERQTGGNVSNGPHEKSGQKKAMQIAQGGSTGMESDAGRDARREDHDLPKLKAKRFVCGDTAVEMSTIEEPDKELAGISGCPGEGGNTTEYRVEKNDQTKSKKGGTYDEE